MRLLVFAVGLVGLSTGCGLLPEPEVQLMGPEWRSLEGTWAVGSTLHIATQTTGVVFPQVKVEGDVAETPGPFWGGVGDTVLIEQGDFTVEARDTLGTVLDTVECRAQLPSQKVLGAYVRGWGWEPDFPLVEPFYLTENSNVDLAVMGLDAFGEPMRGVLDADIQGDGVDLMEATWLQYPGIYAVSAWEGDGAVTFTTDGEEHRVEVQFVPDASVVSLELFELPGTMESQWSDGVWTTLSVRGRTSDGTAVYGMQVNWASEDWTSATYGLWADERVNACLGEVCATWPEAR